MGEMKAKIRKMMYVSLGATLIAVSSWIIVPFAIPFTMQTFAVFFLPKLFGGKIGGLAVLFHLAIGMVGLPVFSGFQSGVSALLSPTGGYIIGFALVGAFYFALDSFLRKNHTLSMILPYICLGVCYALGTSWYMLYISAQTSVGLLSALAVCVLPYVVPDIIKILLATITAERLKKYIKL